MSTHKYFDRICVAAVVISLLLTVLFMNGEAFGIQAASKVMGYESRLFDASRVHTVDIVMDDWDSFVATCTNEEYSPCNVVIDGEAYKNVGIRAKGNTSLSTVASMNSERYSFKLEFDQYDGTKRYHGLDKLSLNNLILDTTYMKDFLAYQLMASFGVDTPLCSYVYITVNGEEWGLYLAVEGVEDAFLQRNYGSDYGALYKPDSGEIGGGRGNGQDFNFQDFMESEEGTDNTNPSVPGGGTEDPGSEGGTTDVTAPQGGTNNPGSEGGTDINTGNLPATPGAGEDGAGSAGGVDTESGNSSAGGTDMGNGMFDRMSSDAVKLQYLGDDFSSYSDILDNAKTDVTDGDKTRLIESLKRLSSGENIENVVNVEEVIRYFVVNNFLVNGDSYVGSMVHNYYLYEEDGKLSMIPWDYNLAYGTFHTLQTNSSVNDPIDTPLSVTGDGDRPMMDWIINDEDYLTRYHQYFAQFLAENDVMAMLEQTLTLITPYVEKDPTRFYTISEFETGVETLRQFLTLRIQSVEGQLAGTIPATSDGQRLNSSALIATGNLVLSDMGAMNMGGMGGFGGNQGNSGEDPSSGGGAQGNTAPNLPEGGAGSAGGTDLPNGMAPENGVPNTDATAPMETLPSQAGSAGGADIGTNPSAPGVNQTGGFEGMRPGGNYGEMVPDNTEQTAPNENLLIVGISFIVLLLGLLVAAGYKRRK